MAREVFKIEGLRDLEKALRELPRATGKNVLRRALMKAGEPIEGDAEARAPRHVGTLKGSVTTSSRLTRRQAREHRKKSTVEIFVGPGGIPQAHIQEFGSAHHPPQRFLTPAWEANRMRALNSIKSDISEEIEKARARLARKAARLAARM